MAVEIVPEMSDELRQKMTDSRSPFLAEDKLVAVLAYLITGGNSSHAVKLAGVEGLKPATIRQWKKRCDWWKDCEEHARGLLRADMDRKYTRLVHKTEEELLDRVENGDVVIAKDGSQVRKPLGGKDLTYIHGIIHDKRAMQRGEPTSRTEKINPLEIVNELAKALQEKGAEQVQKEQVTNEWEPIPEHELDGTRKDH